MGPPDEVGHEVGVRRRDSRELGLCGFNLGDEGKGKGKEKEVESDEDETMS